MTKTERRMVSGALILVLLVLAFALLLPDAASEAQGVTEAQMDAARAVMTLQTGPRSEMAAQAPVFLAANGYEIVEEDAV